MFNWHYDFHFSYAIDGFCTALVYTYKEVAYRSCSGFLFLYSVFLQTVAAAVEEHVGAMPEFTADGKTVEVVFSFDTTGSMSQILHKVGYHFNVMIVLWSHDAL